MTGSQVTAVRVTPIESVPDLPDQRGPGVPYLEQAPRLIHLFRSILGNSLERRSPPSPPPLTHWHSLCRIAARTRSATSFKASERYRATALLWTTRAATSYESALAALAFMLGHRRLGEELAQFRTLGARQALDGNA
jgi:hypothetical protein